MVLWSVSRQTAVHSSLTLVGLCSLLYCTSGHVNTDAFIADAESLLLLLVRTVACRPESDVLTRSYRYTGTDIQIYWFAGV